MSKAFSLCAQKDKLALFADLFATVSFSAQYGNFQRLFLDLTRLNARLDIPSGSTFAAGAVRLAENIYNSQLPDPETIRAVCPDLTVSLQQQVLFLFLIFGHMKFSFFFVKLLDCLVSESKVKQINIESRRLIFCLIKKRRVDFIHLII